MNKSTIDQTSAKIAELNDLIDQHPERAASDFMRGAMVTLEKSKSIDTTIKALESDLPAMDPETRSAAIECIANAMSFKKRISKILQSDPGPSTTPAPDQSNHGAAGKVEMPSHLMF